MKNGFYFMRSYSTFSMLSILFLAGSSQAAREVSFSSLLKEMVDRNQSAQWPSPVYTCTQFSSYDRNSTTPDTPDWWANRDRSFFLRAEQRDGHTEHVLMDADGPGAVVRFWATWHGPKGGPFSNGTIRVYLDNQTEPLIEGPFEDFVDGGMLAGPPLSEGVSELTEYRYRGHNLYLPIPYAEHCKITYEPKAFLDDGGVTGEALYYQINVRTYEPGTSVKTFSLENLKTDADVLKDVQARLAAGMPDVGPRPAKRLTGALRPGGQVSETFKGSQAITRIEVKLEADDLSGALRSVVLKIAFDGKQTVWCPVGDFFGTGYRIQPYATWFTQVDKDGTMACGWVMPFAEQATVTLENLSDQSVRVTTGNLYTDTWRWDDRSLYFHAAWKLWHNIRTRKNTLDPANGAEDLNWVTIRGRGRYVGDVLTLFNGASKWWGEGDEKIYVDGETFPSHFGTGTEDYYGYAWCRPAFFNAPFHAQPCGDGNVKTGFSVNARFRALDAIPFNQSLRFDMELWHWADTVMDYAPTVFWYADANASWNVPPLPDAARLPVRTTVPPMRVQRKLPDAIEGETMKIVRCDGGQTEVQTMEQMVWSGDKQLWWKDASPGQSLVLEFNADKAGIYALYAGLTKAQDYGIVQVSLNGTVLKDGLDLFNPDLLWVEVWLGNVPVKQGANRLEITIKGANSKAEKRHMFGLDYLVLDTPRSSAAAAN